MGGGIDAPLHVSVQAAGLISKVFVIPADGTYSAVSTFGIACGADIASVKQQPMVCLGDEFLGDISNKGPLGLERVLAVCSEPDSLGYSEDMRVHSHSRAIPDDGADNVGGLASYAR